MASLSFIMDVPGDRQAGDRPPSTQKDKEGPNKPHEAPSNEPHLSPGLATTAEEDINPAIPRGQTKRRSASSRRPKSSAPATSTSGADPGAGTGAAAAASPSSSSSSRSQSASTARPSTRRRSSTSNGSMDRTRYGAAAPASSSPAMGGGGPQRPMPLHPTATRFATRITPKTGRVSKAKKGLPVHVCDICSPPKTFTRAEHLRRHKLGHGAPQFQCSSCDKSFHRADLLARHQQKHEHEEDDVPKSAASTQQSPFPSPAALSFKPLHSPRTPGPGPAASPSASEVPPTPNTTTARSRSASGFSQLNNPAHGGSSVYSATRGSSQDFRTSYTLSPTISIVNPAGSYASSLGDFQPRTAPPAICVVTEGLQLPGSRPTELPELHDASPWPSSASDSAYSTPVSEVSRYPRVWAQGPRSPTTVDWAAGSQRLSPYPPHMAPRSQSLGPAIDGIPAASSSLYMNSYSNTQPQEHNFGGMLGVPPSAGFSTSAAAGHHHSSLSASSNSTVRPYQQHPSQHQHEDSASSARSGSPHQLDASSHAGETIVVSAPLVPNRMDSLLGRKGVLMDPHQDLLRAQEAMCGLDVLGGLAAGYGAGSNSIASPGLDHGNHSTALVAELDLAMTGGCAMAMIPSLAIPLPGPIRAAIPRYLEIYWARVDPVLPLVHRQSFEAAPEDVLRCAMAAVATQNLNSREDRNRGNQLHEYAWQEVKRIPQWSLQTMQAILLCDYFARFRGRKAVTRPSKPFESLYSRVFYQNPALLGHAALAADQQHLSIQERWQSWIDTESRRRLFATCLFGDGHAAIYQQQRRTQDAGFELVPLFGRSAMLWGASSAEQWAAMVAANPGALEPEHVPPLEQLTSDDLAQRPLIDRLIILSVFALRLPRRQRPPPPTSLSENSSPLPELDPHTHHLDSQFNVDQHTSFMRHQSHHQQQQQQHQYHHAEYQVHEPYHFNAEERISTLFRACPIANVYLALHHTPLRDLLAVGGDSWVFSQKVLPATSFQEHQKRLRIWASSVSTSSGASSSSHNNNSGNDLAALSVTRATIYAARALLAFLDRQPQPQPQQPQGHSNTTNSTINPSAPWSADMSDYWALYVCALICWAFSHRAPAPRVDTATATASAATAVAASQLQHPHPLHPQNNNNNNNIRHRSSNNNNNSSSSSSSGGSSPAPVSVSSAAGIPPAPTSAVSNSNNANWAEDEHEAVTWLRTVAAVAITTTTTAGAVSEDGGAAAALARLRGRRGAAGVVSLVRRRLEADCLGSRSRLYVDAVGVLRKVEEGGGRKWF